ncbi:unnamed protein product [Cylicocyclus nassatus]|uniref:DUF7027 domain-containing protein n=1 Tax=Cylicocyclus nassatus TaxID=53992 RepID=A0AA36GP62_CYLNA|nr:unnamed protein product [Cylicocyclus nassatus]
MDFDPNSEKWACCCCTLPSGLQILAVAEIAIATLVAALTTHHLVTDTESPSYFQICLIAMMLLMALTSSLLIAGIQRHDTSLMYPTLVARVVLIIFVQVFGVSTVVAPEPAAPRWEKEKPTKEPEENDGEPSVAVRLVMLVFAMLFITVAVFYCIYLVVRCLQYQRCYSRMKERRESFIAASMIDPDGTSRGSRRASSLPGFP